MADGYTVQENEQGKFEVLKDDVVQSTHDTREEAEDELAELIADEDDEADEA